MVAVAEAVETTDGTHAACQAAMGEVRGRPPPPGEGGGTGDGEPPAPTHGRRGLLPLCCRFLPCGKDAAKLPP
jgi:hypothetical protein